VLTTRLRFDIIALTSEVNHHKQRRKIMDMVIRDINAIKVHTFVDMVNYFIRVNGFEGQIECAYGITYRGEQVTSNSTPTTYIEMFDPTCEDTYKSVTTFNNPSLFNDIVATDNLTTIEKYARKFFFNTLDSMGWL
jgi:hypothetical protein